MTVLWSGMEADGILSGGLHAERRTIHVLFQ